MSNIKETAANLSQELRRGTIVLSVLSQLKIPTYGYALAETLQHRGMRIEPGTLYPLLRRLEKQGLLTSEWETSGTKPRKYYALSDTGKRVFELLCDEWNDIAKSMKALISEGVERNE